MSRSRSPYSKTSFLKIGEKLLHYFGPQHWWPADSYFEVMVGAILAQNTAWRNVERAIANLKHAGFLTPQKLMKNRRRLPGLIKPAGFYRQKTRTIVAFLRYFFDRYGGDYKKLRRLSVYRLRAELIEIPGIGYETADSIILYALKRPVFVVDGYTRRIFSRHRIFDASLPYDKIRMIFENNLPRSVRWYNEYHALLVELGKRFCRKNEPLCHHCPLCHV